MGRGGTTVDEGGSMIEEAVPRWGGVAGASTTGSLAAQPDPAALWPDLEWPDLVEASRAPKVFVFFFFFEIIDLGLLCNWTTQIKAQGRNVFLP